MHQNHREVFFEAAHQCTRWIGLRKPNPFAERWIMWTGGVGARELEWVFWFGPGRRFHRGPSSMPRGSH